MGAGIMVTRYSSIGRIASAETATRHVFVRDLNLITRIGIYAHEKSDPQRIVVNIDLSVKERGEPLDDDIKNVVSYEKIVRNVKKIVRQGHVNLVETMAETIAQMCLKHRHVVAVRVRVEKPDIIPEAASVGVEIERVK